MRRRLLALGLCAALGLCLALLPGFVLRVIDTPVALDDSDLRFERPHVPDAENGYLRLEQAAERLWWPDDAEESEHFMKLASGERWDAREAALLVRRNREALRRLARVFELSGFQTPAFRAIDDPLPEFVRWRRLGLVAAVDARSRARAGDSRGAFASALAPIRLGQRIQDDRGGVVIHAMVGTALKEAGLDALGAALPRLRVSKSSARAWSEALLKLETDPAARRDMWAAEYRVMLSLASMPDWNLYAALAQSAVAVDRDLGALADWVPLGYAMQPQRMVQRLAERSRALRAVAGEPCSRLPGPPTTSRRSPASLLAMLTPNGVGEALFHETHDQHLGFERRRCRSDTRLSGVAAQLALLAFEREHGALPERLDALVPEYLPRAPRDHFDGAALRWSRERRLAWSLGEDGADGGGVAPQDLVFALPAAGEPR